MIRPTRRVGSARSTTGSTPSPSLGHAVGHGAQDLVGIGQGHGRQHDRLPTRHVGRSRASSTADQGRTPTSAVVLVEDRVEPLAPLRRSLGQGGVDSATGSLGRHRDHVGVHHLPHERRLQRIDGVLAHDVEAAAGHLLGQDRALEDEHAHQVRDGGRHQEREQAVLVVRQLEGEDDGGEGRPGHAAHGAGQADQRPHARRRPGQHVTEDPADGGTEHQDRGQDAATRAAPQAGRPDEQLHHEQQRQRGDAELPRSSAWMVP